MAGWNRFRKKEIKWDLVSATELVLNILKQSEPAKTLFPLKASVSQSLHKGFVGVHDRWIITVVEIEPGVIRLTMNDIAERRDQQLTLEARSETELCANIETWRSQVNWWCGRLSVYRLQPQKTYRVIQTFTDYYGSVFEAGRELTFAGRNFLPYDGGHTLSFQPASIYLQEDAQSDILSNFDLYFEEVPAER
ncbi:MAG: DUF3601 domain-containing protein [Chloroflexi bacterium]|nr:DUF3601 domain-containing protein [Chloroflexota bacterium]